MPRHCDGAVGGLGQTDCPAGAGWAADFPGGADGGAGHIPDGALLCCAGGAAGSGHIDCTVLCCGGAAGFAGPTLIRVGGAADGLGADAGARATTGLGFGFGRGFAFSAAAAAGAGGTSLLSAWSGGG